MCSIDTVYVGAKCQRGLINIPARQDEEPTLQRRPADVAEAERVDAQERC